MSSHLTTTTSTATTTALLQSQDGKVEAVLVESTNRNNSTTSTTNPLRATVSKPRFTPTRRSAPPKPEIRRQNNTRNKPVSSLRLDHDNSILHSNAWVPFDENTTGHPNYFLSCGPSSQPLYSPSDDYNMIFSPSFRRRPLQEQQPSMMHDYASAYSSFLSSCGGGSNDRYAVIFDDDRDPSRKKRAKQNPQHYVSKSTARAWLASSPNNVSNSNTWTGTTRTTTTTNSSMDWDISSSSSWYTESNTNNQRHHGGFFTSWIAEKSAESIPMYCGFRRIYDDTTHGTNPPYNSTRPRSAQPRRARRNKSHNNNNRNNNIIMSKWKSAKDPKSGRTYYYHVETRETQWRKPMELATQAERDEMESKERLQRNFFKAMEANILKNLTSLPKTPPITTQEEKEKTAASKPKKKKELLLEKPRMVRTISSMDENVLRDLTRVPSRRRLSSSDLMENNDSSRSLGMGDLEALNVRLDPLLEASRELDESSQQQFSKNFGEASLSNFDLLNDDDDDSSGDLLGEEFTHQESLTFEEMQALDSVEKAAEEMKQADNDDGKVDPSLVQSMPTGLVHSPDEKTSGISTDNDTSPPKTTLPRPRMMKRNTCGTLYVGTTMSAPDKDATIKCICGVYRAHILQSATEEAANFMGPLDEDSESSSYLVFNDFAKERQEQTTLSMKRLSLSNVEQSIPTLDEITGFYRDVFRRSQMETDCIIMSLIYVERLIKDTCGALRPRVSNWRSILFSCMVLSSKVWDDLSMWNADFSQTCPAGIKIFTLARINQLEIALLQALKYNVKVKSSEYAKYYFLTRSMIIKSGLGSGDDLASMAPLDVEGAKKLEQVSSNFEHSISKRPGRLRATKSLDHAARTAIFKVQADEKDKDGNDSPTGGDHQQSPVRNKGGVSLEHIVNM